MRSSVTIPAVVAALVPWLLYCSTASAQNQNQNQSAAAGLLRLERSLVEVTRRVEGSVVAIARYRLPGSNADPDRQGPPAPRQSGQGLPSTLPPCWPSPRRLSCFLLSV